MKNTSLKIRLFKKDHQKLTEIKNTLNYDFNVRVSYQTLCELAIEELITRLEAKEITLNDVLDYNNYRKELAEVKE